MIYAGMQTAFLHPHGIKIFYANGKNQLQRAGVNLTIGVKKKRESENLSNENSYS